MAVNWSWKHKVGEIHYYNNRKKEHFKLNLYTGNMMFCALYEWEEEEPSTHTKSTFYDFWTWFNDLAHLRKVLKNDKDYFRHLAMDSTLRKIRLKVSTKDDSYCTNEALRCAQLLARYGYKVEVY